MALSGEAIILGIDRPRCSQCGDVVGVYEPLILARSDGSESAGSSLTLAAEMQNPQSCLSHERCYRDSRGAEIVGSLAASPSRVR